MNAIRPLIRKGFTPDQVREIMQKNPDLAAAMESKTGAQRSHLRKTVGEEYGAAVRDVLLPTKSSGRPVVYNGPYAGISGPSRQAIDEAGILPTPIIEAKAADFTAENVGQIADILIRKYESSPSSQAMALTKLRAVLSAVGVDNEIIRYTARPEITRQHNAKIAAAQSARVAEGFEVPQPFQRIADLTKRIDEFIAGDEPPTGQNAADFLVAFAARPGEAETLTLGDLGGIKGSLKKRSNNEEMPLVTSIGSKRAASFLEKWKETPTKDKRAAMGELKDLVTSWNIQRRDLRAIGANLAVRAAQIAGEVTNTGQARDLHRAALRHAEPLAAAAQDHYARVNDPVQQMCAQLAELSLADRERVRALIDSLQ